MQPAAAISEPRKFNLLNALAARDVSIPRPDEVEKYLADHTDLGSLLDGICQKVRAEFGPATELSLQIYDDPETQDRYLTLYVRQECYDADIIERIETISNYFHQELAAAPGYFLVTTDFRRPRDTHAV